MTFEQLQAQAIEMAQAGAPAAKITQLFINHNIDAGVAAEAASVTVSNYAPKVGAAPISLKDFYDSEVERIREIVNRKCEQFYDRELISATLKEWAAKMTKDVLIFYVDEEVSMDFIFGQKVRMRASGQGTDGVVIDHGIVSANFVTYAHVRRPFAGLPGSYTQHPVSRAYDYEKEEHNFTEEEYKAAVKQHNETENSKLHREEYMSKTIFVRWFDKNGNQQCQGWHGSESLEIIE